MNLNRSLFLILLFTSLNLAADDNSIFSNIYNKHYPVLDYQEYDLSNRTLGISMDTGVGKSLDQTTAKTEKYYVSQQGWKIKDWVNSQRPLGNLQEKIRRSLVDALSDIKFYSLPDEVKFEALEKVLRVVRSEYIDLANSYDIKEVNDIIAGLILDEKGNRVIENGWAPPSPFARYVEFPHILPKVQNEFHTLFFSVLDFNNNKLFRSEFMKLGILHANFEHGFLKDFWDNVHLKPKSLEDLYEKIFNVAYMKDTLYDSLNTFKTPESRFFNIFEIIKRSDGSFGKNPIQVFDDFLQWAAKREDLHKIIPPKRYFSIFFDSLHAMKSRDIYLKLPAISRVYRQIENFKPLLKNEGYNHILYLADRSIDQLSTLQGGYMRLRFSCKGYLSDPAGF